jgi:hypothetical protein
MGAATVTETAQLITTNVCTHSGAAAKPSTKPALVRNHDTGPFSTSCATSYDTSQRTGALQVLYSGNVAEPR